MITDQQKGLYGVRGTFPTYTQVDCLFSGEIPDPLLDVDDMCFTHFGRCSFTVDIYVGVNGHIVLECVIFNTETGLVRYLKDKR